VVIGAILLLNIMLPLSSFTVSLWFLAGIIFIFLGGMAAYFLLMQKILALAAALIFPSLALISTFSESPAPGKNKLYQAIYLVIKVIAITAVGILLMIGLLADYRFMNGIESFPAVKLALVLPVLIVAAYFFFQSGEGNLREKIMNALQLKISIITIFAGFLALAILGFLIARSGNFIIPVPKFELFFRKWLEILFYVRPRSKEILVGYPFLLLAVHSYLKGEKKWLWIWAAIGVIAPVSVFNSFSHIHTPLCFSLIRTLNGLIIGTFFGIILLAIINKFKK